MSDNAENQTNSSDNYWGQKLAWVFAFRGFPFGIAIASTFGAIVATTSSYLLSLIIKEGILIFWITTFLCITVYIVLHYYNEIPINTVACPVFLSISFDQAYSEGPVCIPFGRFESFPSFEQNEPLTIQKILTIDKVPVKVELVAKYKIVNAYQHLIAGLFIDRKDGPPTGNLVSTLDMILREAVGIIISEDETKINDPDNKARKFSSTLEVGSSGIEIATMIMYGIDDDVLEASVERRDLIESLKASLREKNEERKAANDVIFTGLKEYGLKRWGVEIEVEINEISLPADLEQAATKVVRESLELDAELANADAQAAINEKMKGAFPQTTDIERLHAIQVSQGDRQVISVDGNAGDFTKSAALNNSSKNSNEES